MKVSEALVLRPLIEKLIKQEMDGKVAMEFAAFSKAVLTAEKEFESKRAALFEKYGEQLGDGNWQIKEENETKFKSAITRAMNKELDIDSFNMSESGLVIAPADVINVLSSLK